MQQSNFIHGGFNNFFTPSLRRYFEDFTERRELWEFWHTVSAALSPENCR